MINILLRGAERHLFLILLFRAKNALIWHNYINIPDGRSKL